MPIRKGKPNHKSPIPGKRVRIVQTNTLPFNDHRNNTAFMVFESHKNYPLPQLFIFAIYFTHPDASLKNIDQNELLQALDNDLTRFRLELFFIPGASDEDCMDHYHQEKVVRGGYDAQIAMVMESDPDQEFDESYGRLPGWVPDYRQGSAICHYHSLLFICAEKNWKDGEQTMRLVEFDPVSEGEWESFRDPNTPTRLPEKWAHVLPIHEKSPLYKDMGQTVKSEMYGFSHYQDHEITSGPWQEASERGWMSW